MPKFSKDDLVFAKVKGYPPWPAIITDFNLKKKKYEVKFYGTGEKGLIKEEDLRYYLQGKDQLAGKTGNTKRKDYVDALTEIEKAFRIAKTDGSDTNDSDKVTIKVEKQEISRKLTPTLESIIETESHITAKRISSKRKTDASETSDDIETHNDDVPQEKASIVFNEEQHDNTQEVDNSLKSRGARKKLKRFLTEEEVQPAPKITKVLKPKLKKSIKVKKSALDKTEDEEPTELEEINYSIVPVDNLEILITYFDTIKDKATFKKIAPQDLPQPSLKTRVVRAFVPKDATFLGIPYNEKSLPKFNSEFKRASYEANEAKRVIQIKTDIESGVQTVDDVLSFCIPLDGKSTEVERNSILEEWLCQKEKKLRYLKIENDLLKHDSGVKNSLGRYKANTTTALEHLKAMKALQIEALMLKKHPQVFEMAKKLQRYVGNVGEWNMDREEAEIFREAAKEIRVEADQVYDKFYTLMLRALPDSDQINDTIFWTKYMEEIEKLRQETSQLNESDVIVMSSEPCSRASILYSLCHDIMCSKSIYEVTSAVPDVSPTGAVSEKSCIGRPNDPDSSTAAVEGRINIIGNE